MSIAFQLDAFQGDAFQIDPTVTVPLTPARFRLDSVARWTIAASASAMASITLTEAAVSRISTDEQVG